MTAVGSATPGIRRPETPTRENAFSRYFGFRTRGTTLRRDTVAGATTFLVMSYIIFVNPQILGLSGQGGLAFRAALSSTCLVAAVMTVAMGLVANKAYAIAPGMGLNAVVAFGLVAGAKLSWPEAMGVVVMEGILVTLLAASGLRERVMRAIPLALKKAIAVGIGIFIAFIGLVDAGLVTKGDGTLVALAPLTSWPAVVAVFGLIVMVVLRARRVPGDLLIGIVLTTVVATVINTLADYRAFTTPGVAKWPGWGNLLAMPDFSLLGHVSFGSFAHLGVVLTLVFVFSLFLSDFFDAMGTIVGVGEQAGYLNREGHMDDIKKPLVIDGLAAIAGGLASASSATAYVESGAGVGVGGRTGWVSVVTGLLFVPCLFLSPLIGMVPAQATGPALVLVGWMMMSTLTAAEEAAEDESEGRVSRTRRRLAGIDFHDPATGLAAALIIILIPLTYSIATGIGVGFIVYTLFRVAQGRARELSALMYVASLAFLLYFVIPALQAHGIM